MFDNVVYGTYDEETGAVIVSAVEPAEEDYLPVSYVWNDYRIHRDATGYQLFTATGEEYDYDLKGHLIGYTNKKGQKVSLAYTKHQMIIKEEATGKSIECTYSNGHITQIKDPAGNVASFVYDAQENLVHVTSKRGTTNTYTYDNWHHILTGTDTDGVLFLENTYDAKGRVLTQDDGDESTPVLTLSYEDDEETGQIKIHYTQTNRGKVEILSNANGEGITYQDSLGGIKSCKYDANGYLSAYRNPDGTGADYVRDEKDRIISATDTEGRVQIYGYDGRGNQTSYTDSRGRNITWKYDEANLLTSKTENDIPTTYTYNSDGQVKTETVQGKGTKV